MPTIHQQQGTTSPIISQREIDNKDKTRYFAANGMVLLKNDGILPLSPDTPIALYGVGARYTISGGTGSGSVNYRHNVSVFEGLKNAGFHIVTENWLDAYDKLYTSKRTHWMQEIYEKMEVPEDFDALYKAHASTPFEYPLEPDIQNYPVSRNTDTAIYVISRISGEGADRRTVKGDYYLSDSEEAMLTQISSVYKNTIVVLNVGGIIDLSFMDRLHISGLILMSLAGMEGGNALADIITGKINPSGHLTDTWAYHYEDYPSASTFGYKNGNLYEEKYEEGIYVGYRYFDSFQIKPRYCFGYGLSYTSFTCSCTDITAEDNHIYIKMQIHNTGVAAGQALIQIYAACPWGIRKKEFKRLVAFQKTPMIESDAFFTTTLTIDIDHLKSYCTGMASYFWDKGEYYLLAGFNSQDITPIAVLSSKDTIWSPMLSNICPLQDALTEIEPPEAYHTEWLNYLEKFCADNLVFHLPIDKNLKYVLTQIPFETTDTFVDLQTKRVLSKLSTEQKARLVCGQPGAGTSEVIGRAAIHVPGAAGETTDCLEKKYNLSPLVLADGPAGIRIQQCFETDPQTGELYSLTAFESLENRFFGKEFHHENSAAHYQYCTAIPSGTLLAQSFDLELLYEAGLLILSELEEFHISFWLAPGMNIHRNPLCGRNFEYYSEDPLVSGLIASAITQGIQSTSRAGVTIKHYACNNQEDNRRGVSSIVSERALREIYLRGFEIAVKKSNPLGIMTSYNKVNGIHTANSYDLCTTVARQEWGFQGIIMTDWTTTNNNGGSSAVKCIQAGNDLIMPGRYTDIQEILDAINMQKDLCLSEKDLDACAGRMLQLLITFNKKEEAS